MRKRHKINFFRKQYFKLLDLYRDVKLCRRNADATYSARYILDDLNTKSGRKMLADFTGLPEGVIVSAMNNIFKGEEL